MTVLKNDVNFDNLKTNLETNKLKRKLTQDSNKEIPSKKQTVDVFTNNTMLNGRSELKHDDINNIQEAPVASLSNLGNTCYLNSVLYTLRFAPNFLHNLHHLICDLSMINTRLSQNKAKTSSLGRNISSLNGPNSQTKDETLPKSKVQIVTESLHELFVTMHNSELKESSGPIQPNALLHAVREANSIFEGNQQQDAHELLLYLLDNIRDTCDFLTNQLERNPNLLIEPEYPPSSSSSSGKIWSIRRSWKKNPTTKKDKTTKENQIDDTAISEFEDLDVACRNSDTNQRKINFLTEDFEGTTLVRTKCLECESVTEKRELFYDIPIPTIKNDGEVEKTPSRVYKDACVTYEKLFDSNKYFCEVCGRYNEAVREILFEKLPNMMILQLKRFTSSSLGVLTKVNTYLPTPLILDCFCETCCLNETHHSYKLCCVIMHVGSTMASGHYKSYVKVSNDFNSYHDCSRDLPKSSLSASCSEKSLPFLKFLKNRNVSNSLIDNTKNGISTKCINGLKICKSIDCCSVKVNKNVLENALNSQIKKNDHEEDLWLECDDDTIRFFKSEELTNILSKKSDSNCTPYLLFYTRINQMPESDSNFN